MTLTIPEVRDLERAARRYLEASARSRKLNQMDRILRVGEARISRTFERQGRRFVGLLGGLRGTWAESRRTGREAPHESEWSRLWALASGEVRAYFADSLEMIVGESLLAGSEAVGIHLGVGISFDLQNPRAVRYMSAHGAGLVSSIDETTRSYLNTVLTNATEKGWSYSRTASEITSRFAEFAHGVPQQHLRSRAELIAVHESAGAYEEGNRVAAEGIRNGLAPGLVMVKEWLTVGDERVDDTCEASEQDGAIPLEADFVGGSEPPAHPGCRCTCLYDVRSVTEVFV